ncbi:MarR family winged helix-turn-helix transcriptional regulator [Mameliella sediminis]|uniref:MarR family winged helix-turn-helix transcriptional regulator n=1 Tax=Mameliella sediminis TaxID=2836866 RepID=UPI001C437070|nr:MarR family transcriptional regulator [Mameliella sediminis]MBY6116038.1 MarR family transcriptional regulator [Antarctobacter heliothermus]MBY6145184.1 MarR family transcriptional regulator [Mameliella alba]MBV7394077.1 MarR family transcriptional regulator [Mameliella sediminis]MBY6162009.1 MarR family transcriptional regulator [Mameliella alba]MBY6170479.1 MarR family transcriptional regulator [Mameliella alba]
MTDKTSASDKTRMKTETGMIFQHIARQRIRVLDGILSAHGLTSAQVFLLNCLLRTDGMTQVELARELGIGTVGVSGMVDRLEASNWVRREPDERDRRSKRIWLQESATSRKQILKDSHGELDAISYQGLSDEEIGQMLELMRRVRRNLNGALQGEQVGIIPTMDGAGKRD